MFLPAIKADKAEDEHKLAPNKAIASSSPMLILETEDNVAAGRTRYIHPAVLDHCKRPGGPHPGCHPDPKSPLKQANPYNRGCSRHHRCRN
ncbi:hypothetical protein V6N13_027286 [Hibiscus sabdariffa]